MESPQKTPRKRKRREDTITEKAMAYFEGVDKQIIETLNKTHKCTLCGGLYNGQKHYNLVIHLSRRHEHIFEQISEQKEPLAVKRLKLLQNFTEIISVNGRPFEYLHDSGFQKIIEGQLEELKMGGKALNMSDHGLEEVKENLKQTAQKIREIIRNEVKSQPLSLMVDAVTRHRRSILGISIQYSINGNLRIRSIGMIQLTQKHTGRYLADLIIKRLEEFGINLVQIITITTDNGANVQKMIRDMDGILRMEIEKAKHVSTDEQNKATTEPSANYGMFQDESDDDNAIDQLLLAQEIDSTDDDALDVIIGGVHNETLLKTITSELEKSGADFVFDITGVNCAVHTLQLGVKDSIAKMPKAFKNVIELCRMVCKEIRTDSCCNVMQQMNIPYKKPRIETETRWGSMFLMVCFNC